MRKSTIASLILCLTLGITGCGTTQNNGGANGNNQSAEQNVAQNQSGTGVETEVGTEGNEPNSSNNQPQIQSSETKDRELNLDEMVYYINGNKCILGKTTLNEVIEFGAEISGRDFDLDTEIDSYAVSNSYNLNMGGEHWNSFVNCSNYSDDVVTLGDCPITKIEYRPDGKVSDVLKLDINTSFKTPDECIEYYGEPMETSGSSSTRLKYQVDGKEFYGNNGYEFIFVGNDGESLEVIMEYTP